MIHSISTSNITKWKLIRDFRTPVTHFLVFISTRVREFRVLLRPRCPNGCSMLKIGNRIYSHRFGTRLHCYIPIIQCHRIAYSTEYTFSIAALSTVQRINSVLAGSQFVSTNFIARRAHKNVVDSVHRLIENCYVSLHQATTPSRSLFHVKTFDAKAFDFSCFGGNKFVERCSMEAKVVWVARAHIPKVIRNSYGE